MMNGERLGVRAGPPKSGEHSAEILNELGFSSEEIAKLSDSGVIHA